MDGVITFCDLNPTQYSLDVQREPISVYTIICYFLILNIIRVFEYAPITENYLSNIINFDLNTSENTITLFYLIQISNGPYLWLNAKHTDR